MLIKDLIIRLMIMLPLWLFSRGFSLGRRRTRGRRRRRGRENWGIIIGVRMLIRMREFFWVVMLIRINREIQRKWIG